VVFPAWDWVDALGATTVGLALMFALPQLVRLIRTGSGAGLSLTALGNSSVSTVAWLAYGWHVGDPWVVASTSAYAPALAVTIWYARRAGATRSAPWLPLVWIGLLGGSLAVDAVAGTPLFAFVLGGSTLWMVGPTIHTVWTTDDVSGVAPITWWVLLVEGFVFLAYGLAAGLLATVVYAVVCLVGSSGVLSRLAVAHFDLDVPIPVRDRGSLDLAA
jgi:uncharacterized protein with PQ loop repeat